jgi:hypothetical protein
VHRTRSAPLVGQRDPALPVERDSPRATKRIHTSGTHFPDETNRIAVNSPELPGLDPMNRSAVLTNSQ